MIVICNCILKATMDFIKIHYGDMNFIKFACESLEVEKLLCHNEP
jgi:hypothetical protein